MKTRELFITAFMLLLIITLGYVWISPASQTAPDLNLSTATGSQIQIGSKQTKVVLINLWATSCTSCIKEIPHLSKLYQELNPQGLEVVGISMYYDPPVQVMEMVKRKPVPYPVVFDLDKKIIHAFGIKNPITPTTLLISPKGKIVYRKVGLPDMQYLRKLIKPMLDNQKKG